MFKKIDIYGEELKFRFENKEQVNTTVGGYLTVLTGALVVISFWFLSNDIVYRQKPVYYVETSVMPEHPEINLDKYTYPLAFMFTDYSGNVIFNSSLLTLQVSQVIITLQSNGITTTNKTEIPLVQCKREHFPNLKDDDPAWSFIPLHKCIDNQNIKLYRYWDTFNLAYLSIDYSMCDYDLTPDKCGKKEEIQKVIEDQAISASMETLEHSVSALNYSYPLQGYISNPYKFLYNSGSKIVNYMIQNNSVITDSNFILESFDTVDYLTLYEMQTELVNSLPLKSLVQFNVYSSNSKVVNRRSYIKVTEIFGSLGGILNILLVTFRFVNFRFTKIQKVLDIGGWGLGIGDWAQSPIPNPQSPSLKSTKKNLN